MLLVLVVANNQSLRTAFDEVFSALGRQVLMNVLDSWTLLSTTTSCRFQTTFVYYIYIRQSLHRSSFHSAIYIASVTSLRKLSVQAIATAFGKKGSQQLGESKERGRIVWSQVCMTWSIVLNQKPDKCWSYGFSGSFCSSKPETHTQEMKSSRRYAKHSKLAREYQCRQRMSNSIRCAEAT